MLNRFRSKNGGPTYHVHPQLSYWIGKRLIISFPSKEIDREKSLGNYPPARWKTSKDAGRGESQTWDVKWRKMKYRNEITATLRWTTMPRRLTLRLSRHQSYISSWPNQSLIKESSKEKQRERDERRRERAERKEEGERRGEERRAIATPLWCWKRRRQWRHWQSSNGCNNNILLS